MKQVTDKPLSARVMKFVAEMLAKPEGSQTVAAVNAGFAAKNATAQASQMMADPRVKKLLDEKRAEVAERVAMSAADVLRDILDLATADNNDLTQYRIGACRYCHGAGHLYQRTPAEYRRALAAYILNEETRKRPPAASRDVLGLRFPYEGGTGFDPRKNPHPDCPECFGEGEGRTIIQDTRKLSPAARKLYAGVKQTRHGIEVATRSQDKALEMAARHTGVVKSAVELTGKGGGPVQHAGVVATLATTDPIEAARVYVQQMGGG